MLAAMASRCFVIGVDTAPVRELMGHVPQGIASRGLSGEQKRMKQVGQEWTDAVSALLERTMHHESGSAEAAASFGDQIYA